MGHRYDRARHNLDRHAPTYVVTAFYTVDDSQCNSSMSVTAED